jgi:ATP-dependent DNA ligase
MLRSDLHTGGRRAHRPPNFGHRLCIRWVSSYFLESNAPPPGKTRFGSPLVLSRAHWVERRLVAEITYLTWTADGLVRHTVYLGLRSDKPSSEVRREIPRNR